MSRYSGTAHYHHMYWSPENTTAVSLDFRRDGRRSTLMVGHQLHKDAPNLNCEIELLGVQTVSVALPATPMENTVDEQHRMLRQVIADDIAEAFISFMDERREQKPQNEPGRSDYDDIELFHLSVERMCRMLDQHAVARTANAPLRGLGIIDRLRDWFPQR